jgi:hypothetical protein
LLRGETPVGAFDTLCPCASPSSTELVAVYSRGNKIDAHATDILRETFPECVAVPIDIKEHSIIGHFYRAQLLPLFVACLVDYWDDAEMRADLLIRLERAALGGFIQDALNEKRSHDMISKERAARRLAENESKLAEEGNRNLLSQLEALHQSHSWRVTSPLRAIMRMLSRK